MRIRYIFAAASISLLAPAAATAQTQQTSAPLSLSVIEQRLAADGFRVLEIERYPNSVEVKGYDRSGLCVEMHLDPRTGAALRRERDDDCARGDDHRGRHGRRS